MMSRSVLSDVPDEGAEPVLTGGCLCGAVRFRARSAGEVTHCHCRMCQRATGAAFATWVRSRMLGSTGQMSCFRSSDKVRRGFCSACGSTLIMDYDDEDVVWLAIGSLDTPEAVSPDNSIWTAARLPCVECVDADLPTRRNEG
jgi:hypothetical protein